MSDRSRRNARIVLTVAALAALSLVWRKVATSADPRVVYADFGASAAVIAVIAVVNFLSGLFHGRVDPQVMRGIDGIRSGIRDLGGAIVEGLTAVAWRFAQVWDWLRKWFSRIARELYDVIRAVVQRVSKILDKVLGPVIDFLDKVREHIWKIYNDYVKPILDIIEFIRIPLRILSQFNVEWAKKLDATLAQIEDEIVENFQLVLGTLNKTINLLNDIVDVDRLLKRITLLRSILRDVQYLNNLWWNSHTRELTEAQRENYRSKFEPTEPERVTAEMRVHFASGNARISPAVREAIANVKINLRKAA